MTTSRDGNLRSLRLRSLIDASAGPDAVSARLAVEGDADLPHFQHRHGLDTNGKLDADTIRELDVPVADRVRQIEIDLERWRRMAHVFADPRYVMVNLAAYTSETIEREPRGRPRQRPGPRNPLGE